MISRILVQGMLYQMYRICKRTIHALSSAMLAVAMHCGKSTNILPLVDLVSDIPYCLLLLLFSLLAN